GVCPSLVCPFVFFRRLARSPLRSRRRKSQQTIALPYALASPLRRQPSREGADMRVAGAAADAQQLVTGRVQPAYQRREGLGLALVEMVELVELLRRQRGRIGLQPEHAMRCRPGGMRRRRAETR